MDPQRDPTIPSVSGNGTHPAGIVLKHGTIRPDGFRLPHRPKRCIQSLRQGRSPTTDHPALTGTHPGLTRSRTILSNHEINPVAHHNPQGREEEEDCSPHHFLSIVTKDQVIGRKPLICPNLGTQDCFIPLFAITSAGSALIMLRSSGCWIGSREISQPSSNQETSLRGHEWLKYQQLENG